MPTRKMISLTEKTYRDLFKLVTFEGTFDSVIKIMILKEKIATSGQTLAGTSQTAATEQKRLRGRPDK